MSTLDTFKIKVIEILDKRLGDEYVLFLFGSYAKEKAVRSSDIDLAVYRLSFIEPAKVVEIKDEIERTAGVLKDIDLINLTDESISIELLKSVLNGGVIWKSPKNLPELLRNLKKRLSNLEK